MRSEGNRSHEDRLTVRVEAFSDLVFGFSLSLLATRLDVPARIEDIFESRRWVAVIVTFALVCRFWLEHFRIFRHRFVAQSFDLVVNFVFLFAIAVLPYSVQTFLLFTASFPPLALYLGDLSIILIALSLLRIRGLRLRRFDDEDEIARFRDWRRTTMQLAAACVALAILAALLGAGVEYQNQLQRLSPFVIAAVVGALFAPRLLVRKLPRFLRAEGARN